MGYTTYPSTGYQSLWLRMGDTKGGEKMKKLAAIMIAACVALTGMFAFAPTNAQAATKQRTKQLDLTAPTVEGDTTFHPATENGGSADEGWSWDYESRTLTLDNVDFAISDKTDSAESVIKLMANSKIVLIGSNKITADTESYWRAMSASTQSEMLGDLTIYGPGSLTSNCIGGISAEYTLEIEKATITLQKVKCGLSGYALKFNGCNVTVTGADERTADLPLISAEGENANGGISFANCYIKKGRVLSENLDPEYSDYITDYIGLNNEWMQTVSIVAGTQAKITKKPVPTATKNYRDVTLKWKAVPGASCYVIYRATSKKGKLQEIAATDTTSYTDKKLTFNKYYYYRVRALNQAGQQTSATLAVKTALKKPVVTLKRYANKRTIKISWKKVTGAQGYKIYRATKKKGKYKLIKTIKKGSTVSYKNTKLSRSKKYYYKVRAYRKVGKKYVYSPYSTIKVK